MMTRPVKKYVTEINVDNLEMLGRKSNRDSQQPSNEYSSNTQQTSASAPSADSSSEIDDLPF